MLLLLNPLFVYPPLMKTQNNPEQAAQNVLRQGRKERTP
jgi:hypothetical protein